jgi:AcrR family transcriptional regulator
MPTQKERSAATREKLMAVARKLFRTQGYARTFIDDIAARARVTKGAFYHHFADKKAIFLAVFDETEQSLMEASAAGARGSDAWSRFRGGCRAFLEASLDPGVQRIVLRDGPAVLGWETWREIDARYSLGLIEAALQQAMTEGRVSGSLKPLAHLLFGALCEGAMMIARAPKPRAALAEVMAQVDALLAALESSQEGRATKLSSGPRRRSAR